MDPEIRICQDTLDLPFGIVRRVRDAVSRIICRVFNRLGMVFGLTLHVSQQVPRLFAPDQIRNISLRKVALFFLALKRFLFREQQKVPGTKNKKESHQKKHQHGTLFPVCHVTAPFMMDESLKRCISIPSGTCLTM